jgi:hypothetical protein
MAGSLLAPPPSAPSTSTYDPPHAETATARTTGAKARGAGAAPATRIEKDTFNDKQSQIAERKLAAGGGLETAAKKPHNKKVPGPHH